MVSVDLKYDEIFLDILQDKKSIVGFLQAVFNFLARRTDFYHVSNSESEGLGFPLGVREKIVQEVMLQCDPKLIATIENSAKAPDQTHNTDLNCEQEINEPSVVEIEDESFEIGAESFIETTPGEHSKKSQPSLIANTFQQNEYYNGACYGTYCWSQTITEVELYVLLPDHILSSKQLSIQIESDFIKIMDKAKVSEEIFGGKLSMKCRSSEAVWSLSSRKLQITLDKTKETWWDRFLEIEPKLDLTKMDCSRPFEELPEESQAAIEKLRWDHQQKILGLPTSEELKNQKLLRQAWDAEGSPFRGQPFDPSAIKFN